MRVHPPAPGTVVHEDQGADGARRSEVAISYLLRVGVVVSLLVVVTGTIVTFVHHPEYVRSSAAYVRLTAPRASPFRAPGDVIDGLRHMKGQAVVTSPRGTPRSGHVTVSVPCMPAWRWPAISQ